MLKINFIARALCGLVISAFLVAGIFDVLDYFIVKFLLIGTFVLLVAFTFIQLYKSKNHPNP